MDTPQSPLTYHRISAASFGSRRARECARTCVTLTSFTEPTVSITSQQVTIHYLDRRRRRRYTPEFLVAGARRGTELIEIKYNADLRRNQERSSNLLQDRELARDVGEVVY